jgi:hypothetical protein
VGHRSNKKDISKIIQENRQKRELTLSLIYRKRQKSYDSDTITLQKYQLFDLEVKGQRQYVVMLVHETPSRDYTHTYQISFTYLKRQKSYGPTDSKLKKTLLDAFI